MKKLIILLKISWKYIFREHLVGKIKKSLTDFTTLDSWNDLYFQFFQIPFILITNQRLSIM